MTKVKNLTLLGLLLLAPKAAYSIEYTCNMTIRSSIEGNDGLDDHGYRMISSSNGFYFQQRMADGTWMDFGSFTMIETGDFVVFIHLPEDNPNFAPSVSMLTIYQSGESSLVTHYGDWGAVSQYKRAWLTQGECHLDS